MTRQLVLPILFEGLQKTRFANLELQTVDLRTQGIVGYLFDSWRCAAQRARIR